MPGARGASDGVLWSPLQCLPPPIHPHTHTFLRTYTHTCTHTYTHTSTTYTPKYTQQTNTHTHTSDGKVCLSLLGTFHGANAAEKWSAKDSSLYQILLSVQGLILIEVRCNAARN